MSENQKITGSQPSLGKLFFKDAFYSYANSVHSIIYRKLSIRIQIVTFYGELLNVITFNELNISSFPSTRSNSLVSSCIEVRIVLDRLISTHH